MPDNAPTPPKPAEDRAREKVWWRAYANWQRYFHPKSTDFLECGCLKLGRTLKIADSLREIMNDAHGQRLDSEPQITPPALTASPAVAEAVEAGDWFAGDVDSEGNELVTVRADGLLALENAVKAASALATCCMARACYSPDELEEMARATKPTFDAALSSLKGDR